MLFGKLGNRSPLLADLDEAVLPLGPDEGAVVRRTETGLRVRSNVKAGGNAGEGGGGTDRHNVLRSSGF